jgi:hypothetical protein
MEVTGQLYALTVNKYIINYYIGVVSAELPTDMTQHDAPQQHTIPLSVCKI